MLNAVWLALVLGSVLFAAVAGNMEALSAAVLPAAENAVSLVIKLTGAMMLFLGLVRIATEGGLLRAVVRVLRPLLRRLFPEVPEDHPAMGAITMNFAANMLGLGNAATPFGIKAVIELDKLSALRGSASNAMALFLAINTSSIVLMAPTGTVAVRAATGSEMPFAIWLPTLIATACSTLVAVGVCLSLQRLSWFRPRPPQQPAPEAGVDAADSSAPAGQSAGTDAPAQNEGPNAPAQSAGAQTDSAAFALAAAGVAQNEGDADAAPGLRKNRRVRALLTLAAVLLVFGAAVHEARLHEAGPFAFFRDVFSAHWLLPILVFALASVGFVGRVAAYDAMIAGAREALGVALRIAPYLLAILVAVAMFRASGALALLVGALDPVTGLLGVPAEALPMALLRPLSGSGAYGVMTEILSTHGPDSFVGLLASTLMGSTETTFYVLAVYLGAAGVRDTRHILPACLAGDAAGFVGAVVAVHLFFG